MERAAEIIYRQIAMGNDRAETEVTNIPSYSSSFDKEFQVALEEVAERKGNMECIKGKRLVVSLTKPHTLLIEYMSYEVYQQTKRDR